MVGRPAKNVTLFPGIMTTKRHLVCLFFRYISGLGSFAVLSTLNKQIANPVFHDTSKYYGTGSTKNKTIKKKYPPQRKKSVSYTINLIFFFYVIIKHMSL